MDNVRLLAPDRNSRAFGWNMASREVVTTLTVLVSTLVCSVATEELPELPKGCLSSSDERQCYSAGDITGAVLGTLLATLALLALGYAVYRLYWRGRRGKHLVLVTDPEGGISADDYAFDNPCFRDGTPIGRGGYEKEPVKSDHKNRWSAWSPLGAIVGTRNEKRRALDDSFPGEPQVSVVSLRSHDFTGLGFNVCGNMRDGIYVKDVLHRGPASESGRISPGDRIDSIRISFRHMVFEDALTILSYASPYEVQLEVENPSPASRPSTLIRTKRSSIEPADRICHPFYRSQSIADLAQIGQDAGSKMSRPKSELWDESRAAEYPTLKLSPSPTKDTVKLEKASSPTSPASLAIVKPERARRVPPKGESNHNEGTPSKPIRPEPGNYHKFGVRVLPDPKTTPQLRNVSEKQENVDSANKQRPTSMGEKSSKSVNIVEAERRENERNSMVEKTSSVDPSQKGVTVSGGVMSEKMTAPKGSVDEIDAGRMAANSSSYDERGIDVGPAEEEENRRKASLSSENVSKVEDVGTKMEGNGPQESHSNVKLLITKGFQNLKEKLHHHDRKKANTSPEPQSNASPETDKGKRNPTTKKTKTSESSDSDGAPERQPKSKDEGKIPTEIPEEMHRAAMAARNNRRSSGYLPPDTQVLSMGPDNHNPEPTATVQNPEPSGDAVTTTSVFPPVKYRVRQQESLSEDSSGDDLGTGNSGSNDNDGNAPKRSNKRKAPVPPFNDDGSPTTVGIDVHVTNPVTEINVGGNPHGASDKNSGVTLQQHPIGDHNVQTMEVRIDSGRLPAYADIPKQQNNPSNNDITNIAVESSGGNPITEDLHINVDNLTSKHSDSDSDSDTDASPKRTNNGGTTIELNSSHITIHHSPSSDTTPASDGDSTRKAASMGDLSRLESDQPMSVLERAVSLDLADGTTPHSCKKRKAPQPPPVDVQDSDDGGLYRKEPRLDTALDTFQRRRLKKSSDWGTMEDAVQQGDEPTSLTISIGEDEPEVFVESRPQKGIHVTEEVKVSNVPVASIRTVDAMGRAYLMDGVGVKDESAVRSDSLEGVAVAQRTVWRVTPEVTVAHGSGPSSLIEDVANAFPRSQVTIAQGSGPSSIIIDCADPNLDNVESIATSQVTIGHGSGPESLVEDGQAGVAMSHVTIGQSSGPSSIIIDRTEPQVENVNAITTSQVTIAQSSGPSSVTIERVEPALPFVDTIAATQVVIGKNSGPSSAIIEDRLEPRNKVDVTQRSGPSNLVTARLVRSTTPENESEINGSRLLTFIQDEYRNSSRSPQQLDEEVEPDTSTSENHTIVSSTPIAMRDHVYRRVESIQSPKVTSSGGGVRNINIVSSTTRRPMSPDSELNISGIASVDSTIDNDSNVSVTSSSEPFITATNLVDSTTTITGNSDEEDSPWSQDSQPPELPTSPVPVLATSPYNPSSSMTYITEIQVTTLTPGKTVETINGDDGNREVARSRVATRPMSISPDSMGSDSEDLERSPKHNGTYDNQRSNVTVTAIRNGTVGNGDRSRIPMRIGSDGVLTSIQRSPSAERTHIPMRPGSDVLLTTFQSHSNPINIESHIPLRLSGETTSFQNVERSHIPMRIVTTVLKETSPTGNGIGEKKGKAVRPPVPPRKSDASVTTVEVQNSNRSPEHAQGNALNSSGGKKFISFSSLTPRPVSDGSTRNSSFEQWVFLDEGQGRGSNGQSSASEESSQNAANRPPSVTHIVLDSKQSSGKRGSQ